MTNARYDAIAGWYDTFVRDEANAGNFVLPHLFELAADLRDRTICDLACGQGSVSRALAQRGAHVVGIDISEALLTIAKHEEELVPLGITYVQDNAEQLVSVSDAQFDGVVCNMALMDIDDLDAVCFTIGRILRPGGWFVFNITHPCFESPDAQWLSAPDGTLGREIRHYFDEGCWRSKYPTGLRGKVGVNHRMLSTYFNTLVRAGFSIERICEPQAQGVIAECIPGYRIIPSFILVRCLKQQVAFCSR
jgi:ubiquinone/menaquinone biosynthesis C-methylase UbiE